LTLFGRDLDHPCVLIDLEQFLQTSDLRHFTGELNGQTQRFGILQLNLQRPGHLIGLLHGGHLNRHLNLRPLLGPDLKPDLLKVLIPLIAPDRIHVLVEVVELLVVALGYNPEEERVALWGHL
jgi:hypothetical protein